MEEMIEIINEKGHTIKVVPRSEMRKKNLKHKGTFILVFDSKNEILITKRTMTKDLFPGLYEIKHGGTVSVGESFEENAKKELKEELGIKKVPLNFLFDFSYKDSNNNVLGRVFECVYDGPIKMQKEEVESYEWISMGELKKRIKSKRYKFCPDHLVSLKKYFSMKK